MIPCRAPLAVLAAAAAWSYAGEARAGYPDLWGFGPEAVAHAGAGVANAQDFAATFTNPAGLGFATRSSVHLGGAYVGSALEVRGEGRSIPDPWGAPLGLVLRLPAGTWLAEHLRAGFGAYVMPDTIVHIVTRLPGEPGFPYYENRTQRVMVLPAVALRLHETLALGVAANFFAGLSGPAAARDGPARAVETTITEEIFSRAAVIAGLRFEPTRRLALGLVYRQRFAVPYTVFTQNRVGGVPLDITVDAEGLFSPDELVLGARYGGERFRVVADLRYALWSAWRGPFVRVEASLPGLELSPAVPSPGFRDTWSLRVGGSYRLPRAGARGIELRGGLGFEPSMVGDQPGRTNLFDDDRWVFALGAAMELPPLWGVTSRFGVAAQVHHLGRRTFVKRYGTPEEAARDPTVLADEDASRPGIQTTNAGHPAITGGGQVWTLTWGLEVEL